MLTRGSLSLICEDLGDSEKIVACFASLSHDVPKEMKADKFCYSVPYFPTGCELVDFIYDIRQIGGYREKKKSISLKEGIISQNIQKVLIIQSEEKRITLFFLKDGHPERQICIWIVPTFGLTTYCCPSYSKHGN